MVEYIDKNATVGILEAMSRNADCECIKKRLEKAAKRVNTIPAADVAPVVRCKDCKYEERALVNGRGFLVCLVCPASGMEIKPDDFCSYGERKDGGAK